MNKLLQGHKAPPYLLFPDNKQVHFTRENGWVSAYMALNYAEGGKISVCSITKNVPAIGSQDMYIPIWLMAVNKGCLQVLIDKQKIKYAVSQLFFLYQQIELTRTLKLPRELSASLGMGTHAALSIRRYPMFEDHGFYHHFLDVSI